MSEMNHYDQDYQCVMPFWIDTDAYSDRDRQMFVCGVEFQMVYEEMKLRIPIYRTIHTENESRIRMMAGRLGRRVEIRASEVEGWSYLECP